MKLWIDDVRPAPPDWVWAMTLGEALDLIEDADCDEVSLDHDLGGDDTAMPVAQRIEQRAFDGERAPPKWYVHSANPVGRKNLEAALRSAERCWHLQNKPEST